MSFNRSEKSFNSALPALTSTALSFIRSFLRNDDSKRIFYFLLLNLSYMLVQLLYGYWTNSLGLISDAIHMFFDCLALGVGLVAAVMSRWPANKSFTFGFARLEVLAGFSNGIFLVLISLSILVEAIQRLLDPPEMKTENLLLVSFLGLVVNLMGIFAFNHGHAHGHSHSHGHGHSHDDHDHAHHNSNMHAVFLHVLADTMGSVGVIVSTLLINHTGWTGFDPIASIFIAVLIFASVVPLLKQTGSVLLLKADEHLASAADGALHEVTGLDGVISCSVAHFFPVDEHRTHGILHLQLKAGADQAVIMARVHDICKRRARVTSVTVQIEREDGWRGCSCGGFVVRNEDVLEIRLDNGDAKHSHEHHHHHHHGHEHGHLNGFKSGQFRI